MRAHHPDHHGHIERNGVRVFYEVFGHGEPTILLLPTWSIIHSRHWKMQVPYLARHYRVVTFDGRGNGRSDRPTSPEGYADKEFVDDAVAVMDATETRRAVVVGFSNGGRWALQLAAWHPERGVRSFRGLVPSLDAPGLVGQRGGPPSEEMPVCAKQS
jgi:pimeloyl-ACP methyl ester carboxylesterase